jgi:hypothetical protein
MVDSFLLIVVGWVRWFGSRYFTGLPVPRSRVCCWFHGLRIVVLRWFVVGSFVRFLYCLTVGWFWFVGFVFYVVPGCLRLVAVYPLFGLVRCWLFRSLRGWFVRVYVVAFSRLVGSVGCLDVDVTPSFGYGYVYASFVCSVYVYICYGLLALFVTIYRSLRSLPAPFGSHLFVLRWTLRLRSVTFGFGFRSVGRLVVAFIWFGLFAFYLPHLRLRCYVVTGYVYTTTLRVCGRWTVLVWFRCGWTGFGSFVPVCSRFYIC